MVGVVAQTQPTHSAPANVSIGTIVARDGAYAIVRIDEGGCGRCHEPGGCGGSANVGRIFCSEKREYRAFNPERIGVGETVSVSIAAGAVRRSALKAYALPLLLLFIGAIGGASFGGSSGGTWGESASIGGAVCGLVFGWWLLARDRRRSERDPSLQPVVRARVHSLSDADTRSAHGS